MKSGKSNTAVSPGSLSPIHYAILWHTAGYRMTTSDVWETTPDLVHFGRVAIGAAVRELTRQKLLVQGSLHHGRHYFALTSEAVNLLTTPGLGCGLLSEQAKLLAYSRMLLACNLRHDLKLISTIELGKQLKTTVAGLPDGFALKPGPPTCLAFVRVDASAQRRPSRSAQSIRGDILRFAKHSALREFLKRQKFEYIWITPTELRAQAVIKHFRKYDRVGKSPVTVIVLPQILPLLISTSIKKEVFNR